MEESNLNKVDEVSTGSKIEANLYAISLATIEILYFFIPVTVYAFILMFSGDTFSTVKQLPAWSFLTLAVYFTIVRDAHRAFHRKAEDKNNREVALVIGLAGITLSTMILVLNVIRSKDPEFYVMSFIHDFQFQLLMLACAIAWLVKIILFKREDR